MTNDLIGLIQVQVNDKIYLKDPNTSELGKRIITHSIILIDEIGFEAFTFKKLGNAIGSPESTIYRYFENKHRILLYLISWYWGWLEYHLIFGINNIKSPVERLSRALEIITGSITEDKSISHINEEILNRIVIAESFKAYHNKFVDKENKEGLYMPYKRLVQRVSDLVLEVSPDFKYPHMLISTVIEGTHHQHFFADHIPSLTNVNRNVDCIPKFYIEMVFATIYNKETYIR